VAGVTSEQAMTAVGLFKTSENWWEKSNCHKRYYLLKDKQTVTSIIKLAEKS